MDMGTQRIAVGRIIAPYFTQDFFPCNQRGCLAQQCFQQFVTGRRQRQFVAGTHGFAATEVKAQFAEFQDVFHGFIARAPDQCLEAGFEFDQGKRFDQVIIGTDFEADQLVLHRIARGQHQYRRCQALFLAQLAADFDAIQARQFEVEHDHIVM
ncbi:hypothetical protein D3C81_1750280 [compost metagenome]